MGRVAASPEAGNGKRETSGLWPLAGRRSPVARGSLVVVSLIDSVLADILVCPKCHGPLEQNESARRLDCLTDGLGYPVRDDGIPVMLIDEAHKIGVDQDGE